MSIKAMDCPIHNPYWYDMTDIATAQSAKNTKMCVNLDCDRDYNRIVTYEGYPFYDPFGVMANSYP